MGKRITFFKYSFLKEYIGPYVLLLRSAFSGDGSAGCCSCDGGGFVGGGFGGGGGDGGGRSGMCNYNCVIDKSY